MNQPAIKEQFELIKLDAPELSTIEPSKAVKIRATFEPMAKMLEEFEILYSDIIQESEKEITYEVCGKAKRLRIDIGRVRIETEKLRKVEKEEYLRAGKAIDGVSNILKWAVTDKENRLKEIENHFEIMEQKRLEALQADRVIELSKYVEDAEERDLSSMDEDVWHAYITTKEREHTDRIEAERKAEADRIEREAAEAKEQERIRKENEQLKKEAEKKAKAEKKRLTKEKIEREAREAELKKARDQEAAAKKEQERAEREKQEAIERSEKAERDRIAAEKKAKADQEAAVKKAQEDERKRHEEEQREKAEAEAKEKANAERIAKNKKHQAKINNEIVAAFVKNGIDEEMSKNIIRLVVSGKILHMTVNY